MHLSLDQPRARKAAAIKLVRGVRETSSAEPAKIGGYRKPLLAR